MSLFGNSTAKPSLFSAGASTASASPFGATNTSQPATSSLFGSTQTTKPAASTSLFGSVGAASTSQPQQNSLFGATTQNQPQSSLFGATTQSQASKPTLGGSLFGSTTTTQAPQQGSLFTSTTQQPQQQGASLFGQTATQPAQGSLLGSTSQTAAQNGNQSGAYFDAILEKSRKRLHAETAGEDLPSLQLGLGDLRQRIKRIGTGAQEQRDDGRAHYLLAASGVDPGAAIRDLNLFNAQSSRVERLQPVETVDTDVEGYLANLQSQTTLNMIADGLARSVRDFDTFLEDNVTMEWDAQRKRIYEHFGIKPRDDLPSNRANASFAASVSTNQGGFGRSRKSRGVPLNGSRAAGTPGASSFGRSNASKSVLGSAGPIGTGRQSLFADVEKRVEGSGGAAIGPTDRITREKQSKFIEKVQALNKSRINKQPYPVLAEFCSVSVQTGEASKNEIANSYRALISILGENPEIISPADPSAIKERQFADAYLDDTPNSAKSLALRKRILSGSTKHLEKTFFERLESFVEKNPREANLGGVPNILSKVKAYVRIRAARKNLAPDEADLQMLGDDYLWALIFFLLRSGHVKEAVDYVTSNAVAFRAIDRNFATYLTAYYSSPDRRLRRDLQDRIHSEYNQRQRNAPDNSLDPFRMACYKVIGRCGLENRNLDGLLPDTDDYLWLQFVLAREVSLVDEVANEVYNLETLQEHLILIGNRHFKAGSDGANSGIYFMILVLAGLFEQAIDYLYPFQHVEAVHFAIALDFYGLLRVSDPAVTDSDFMSRTTRGQPQISFAYMLGYYTGDFRTANVVAAVDYLSLICLNKDLLGDAGKTQLAMCHESLRELVLESREFALLLGDIRADGQRIRGAIEERLGLIGLSDTNTFMRAITIQAASIADDNGRTTDAVLLYHLAEEFDNVIVIITRALSEAVSIPIGQDPMRLQPLKPRVSEKKQAPESSLSLTSVDDPVILAKEMTSLYGGNQMYLRAIKAENKDACGVLLRMSEAKVLVEREQWPEAMDIIIALDILPLKASGNASEIRSYASKFSSLPQAVANNVPNLLMWTITCCNRERAKLSGGQFGGNDGTRRLMIDDLKQKNMDLTTYTSQLRYRFPAHLHEALARAISE
ncbi:hypothetical protein BP5796_00991 [Coleophoma crateriformis]|uniref:Nucleoporin-interacting protein NIC96 n=1 Tax=Coleophoma crateriformis TaxID=565419 RepID=A0A3D8TC02_9HELO|nr:hypothetical protein BP5796_00991 [Coleophoma crateriformis]